MLFIGRTDAQAVLTGEAKTAPAAAGYNTTTLGVGDYVADSAIHAFNRVSTTEGSGLADYLSTPARGMNDLIGSGTIDFRPALKGVSSDEQPALSRSSHASGSDTFMIAQPVISSPIGSEY